MMPESGIAVLINALAAPTPQSRALGIIAETILFTLVEGQVTKAEKS
jgi:hypothetical protein